MRSRAHTLVEFVVAFTLFLVMIPALFPSPRPAVQAVRGGLEVETARLIAEGELATARKDAAAGLLKVGARPRATSHWASASNLRDPRIQRRVIAGPDGLLEVTVRVSWRSLSGDASRAQRLELATWVALGAAR